MLKRTYPAQSPIVVTRDEAIGEDDALAALKREYSDDQSSVDLLSAGWTEDRLVEAIKAVEHPRCGTVSALRLLVGHLPTMDVHDAENLLQRAAQELPRLQYIALWTATALALQQP